jgi:hypothetical protein
VSAIEAFLVNRLTQELAGQGVQANEVTVVSGEADHWQYLVRVGDRLFDLGFSHSDRLWCHELTSGREQPLVSNDEPPICTSTAARQRAVERIAAAIMKPEVVRRDPPVI